MASAQEAAIRQILGALLADITVGKLQPEAPLAWTWEQGWISVKEEGFKALRAFLSRIEKQKGIEGRFSHQYLEKKLQGLVTRECAISSAPTAQAVESIMKDMLDLANVQLQRRWVNVPVFGMKVFPGNMSIKVGNVEFYTLENTEKRRWLPFVERDTLVFKKGVASSYSDVWAKVDVEAAEDDSAHLQEACVESVRQAMSALLLFLFAYPVGDYNVLLYSTSPPQPSIWRALAPLEKCYVVELPDQQNYEAGAAGEYSAPLRPLRISDEVLQEYRKNGFDALSDLIGNPRTELQKRIYDSLKLFWTAYSSPEPAVSYLNYAAMLEMLVMKPKERAITNSMSLRISWVLGENDSPEDRHAIREEIAKLYDDRSLIAHGQMHKVEDISEKLLTLRVLAYRLTKRLAGCRNYTSQEDVVRWARAKVLGASDPFDKPLAQPWIS
jgi:hypothetical protein